MHRGIPIFVLLGGLVGCAAHAAQAAQPPAAASPVVVEASQRERYWTPVHQTLSGDLPGSHASLSTRVVVAYTINAEGRVTDAAATSFEPAGSRPDWALDMVRANHFEPGPDNPQRRPIRTSTEVTLGAAAGR